ncbi:STAS domain-containing protein [Yinghuangia seranimata]|uniref:STAS domain-containing protein n=1 Tax=Yinghuangia seranimata TaxID=408067 RepID=UPI00248BF01C|nr:STAS domain-containing protein [Yinghuangia seranimata]MDI2125394.1 STAS domain-containing protein [Yinghuangia seranimata]
MPHRPRDRGSDRTAPARGDLRVETADNADGVRLLVAGELDRDSAEQLRATVDAALKRQPGVLVIDLSGVTFCDSSGLHVLLHARRAVAAHGGELTLRTGRTVDSLLHITGTARLFMIAPDTGADAGGGGRRGTS